MGCASSRESAVSSPNRPTAVSPPVRTTSFPTVINSQTAINPVISPVAPRLHTTTSNSNHSTPRSSLGAGSNRHSQSRPVELSEHYNHALLAPKSWMSTDRLWSRAQLRRERADFFHSRVTGQREIWDTLQHVTQCIRDGELVDAQGILEAAGITLPTGYLEDGSFDERGQLYPIPVLILSDPLNVLDDDDGDTVVARDDTLTKKLDYDTTTNPDDNSYTALDEKLDKGKDAIERDAIKIKCRLSDRGGPDTMVQVGPSQPAKVLVRRLRAEAALSSSTKIRLAYMGKVLDENLSLDAQGWQQGHVVQALVSALPS